MDWLDQYLNGLGEYKTTVSPADTHMWGVKPKLNNIQERMQFDAAAQSELEFRQIVQEARAELETQGGGGMSVDDVEAGIGADPGSPTVQTTTTPAAAFPASITLTGSINSAPGTLFPISSLSELSPLYDSEITSLADQSVPYRIYLSYTPNGEGTYDYIYMVYLANATAGYYPENVSAGRWFIGNGYSFSGDNSGYYTNYGIYSALQSKSTPPSSNIANWTRIPGSYPNLGNITAIEFNY